MHHILEYEDFLADKGLVLEASKKDAKVLNKLIDSNLKNSQEMKKVVGQWKKAEGQEKADLTSKLKELTLVKQDLEKKIAAEVEELDKGIGLEVVDESVNENENETTDYVKELEKAYNEISKEIKKSKKWSDSHKKELYKELHEEMLYIISSGTKSAPKKFNWKSTEVHKEVSTIGPAGKNNIVPQLWDIVKESVNEATHEFNGKMLRNMEVGGAGVGPFASTPKVKLKKGQKVKLIIQTGGSMGDNYQFWDPKTGKKLGNKWDHQLPDKITNIVDY